MDPRPLVRRILVARGTVQGVGFRPFAYRHAAALGLSGTICNEPAGVRIDVEGERTGLAALEAVLRGPLPPLARLDRLDIEEAPPRGASTLAIVESETAGARAALPPPDTAPCDRCEREIGDPGDRRYHYPFINCTACGPRFTVVTALPYDRGRTTMAPFPLCAACRDEYEDPASRRFHAEPNACPQCGPNIAFHPTGDSGEDSPALLAGPDSTPATGDRALRAAVDALRKGAIVAVKGVGGFHLACDARSSAAVVRLRARKRREAKPFALLAADVGAVLAHASASPGERHWLESAARPIVLLERRPASGLAAEIAPGLREVGFFLPPSPLHALLARAFEGPLVMTSGNLSEEPIAIGDDEARARLGGVADAFLVHDRAIAARADDSVVRVERGVLRLLRRARGFVPGPLPLASPRPLLAVGADLKSAFCMVAGGAAHVSQHLGGLAHPETGDAWIQAIDAWSSLLGFEPEMVACDLHPDYRSTRFAESLGLPLVRVQHHHAHVAACLAEHGHDGPVVGVALDGAGFGLDGAVWGGEILVADLRRAERVAHLRYVRLPGGDTAARAPWRMALAYLDDAGLDIAGCGAPEPAERVEALGRAARRGIGSPWTSSAGRLFDAVAAMLGVRAVAHYEGQAAMELEAASGSASVGAADRAAAYPFRMEGRDPARIDLREAIRAIAADARARRPVAEIGARFHATVAAAVAGAAAAIAAARGIKSVVLSGGCFQNARLAAGCEALLEAEGLRVLRPAALPPNDGGVCLGQAAIAAMSSGG